jgi:hypothetical protein
MFYEIEIDEMLERFTFLMTGEVSLSDMILMDEEIAHQIWADSQE